MRRMERFVVYSALGILGVMAIFRDRPARADGPADGAFGALTVRELKLVGPDGQVLARLHATEDGGRLEIDSKDGKLATALTALKGGGGALWANGTADKAALYAGADTGNGGGLVRIYQKEGALALDVAQGPAGGKVQSWNADGKLCAFLGAADGKGGMLYTCLPDGARVAEVSYTSEGGQFLTQTNEGKVVASVKATATGGILAIGRRDGADAATVSVGAQGGQMLLVDGTGKANPVATK